MSSNVKVLNTTDDTDPSDNSDATKDLRSLQMLREGDQELEFIGIATTEVKKDGKIHYEKEFYLDGYVNYTEPPKQWPARTNYTCEWYTDKDPFLLKMKKPFTFEVENTTSAPKACDKGKDKVTEKKSKTADGKWLNQVKTVFKTNKPKKDDPRAFTIEQKYTVNTFAGSNKKVSAVLTYNYEWVEGEKEPEETAPEGGYWRLAKIEVDDSKATSTDSNYSGDYIKGKEGNYTAHNEWMHSQDGVYSCDRKVKFQSPKKIYLQEEAIELEIVHEQATCKGSHNPNDYPFGWFKYYNLMENKGEGKNLYNEDKVPRYDKDKIVFSFGNVKTPKISTAAYGTIKPGDYGFYIREEMNAADGHCKVTTTYYYEWVK